MHIRIKKLDQLGDTIIEVLIALVIIGTVLGGAFQITSLSLKTELNSNHRSQALKIAETQIETMKTQYVTSATFAASLSGTSAMANVCMNGVALIISPPGNCVFDSTGAAAIPGSQPSFTVAITSKSTLLNKWSQIEEDVTWTGDNANVTTPDRLTLYYNFNNKQ
jgi:type II secretory pathway pseudopilin PulG